MGLSSKHTMQRYVILGSSDIRSATSMMKWRLAIPNPPRNNNSIVRLVCRGGALKDSGGYTERIAGSNHLVGGDVAGSGLTDWPLIIRWVWF
jgi:hypothetical protein